jgi:RNA polymerase sigma-70 factor (ECF subfamily)
MMADRVQTQSSESTSRSLLRRARERDAAAWEKLTAVYSPLVYEWCRRAGVRINDAADVVQEVFRSVATGLSGFRKDRPGDTFRGWLWTITRNKIHDHFRVRTELPDARGGTAAQFALQQLPDETPRDAEQAEDARLQSKLARRAVCLMQSDFEESTWQAFWLTAVEQQPAQAVAEQLDMSTAAVYMAKSRVLRRLREELDGLDLME